MRPAFIALLLLAGCGPRPTPEMAGCERQADRDPVVQDLIMKGAGSEHFMIENQARLREARQRAMAVCLRTQGLAPRGGVEGRKTP